MITPFESRWASAHRLYSNNPQRVLSVDGSVETWSRQLTRMEDIPVEIAALMEGRFDGLPYCVRSPAVHNDSISEPESFLFLEGSRLAVAKRSLAGVTLFQADLADIDAVETETALLHSVLTIVPRDGRPERIPFNSVVEDLFAPVVEAYLRERGGIEGRDGEAESCAGLLERDFKYYVHARGVLGANEPKALFYHPTEAVPELFHGSRVIPSYLVAAMGSMVVCFSEGQPFRSRGKAGNSMVVRYLPRSAGYAIGSLPVRGESRYRTMVLRSGSVLLELPLARSAQAEFEAFAQAANLPELAVDRLQVSDGAAWRSKVG
jgi:hypothetical protein